MTAGAVAHLAKQGAPRAKRQGRLGLWSYSACVSASEINNVRLRNFLQGLAKICASGLMIHIIVLFIGRFASVFVQYGHNDFRQVPQGTCDRSPAFGIQKQ